MSRLLIPLMTGLLWAASPIVQARELPQRDPVRATLVDLARDTPASGLPADARITLSRAWVDGAQAKVCAVARDANGDLMIQNGQLQMKRVQLSKRGSKWRVDHAERLVMGPKMTIDTACQQRSPDAMMADAIKLLNDHPPTAGIKATPALASAACHDESGKPDSKQPGQASAPGVVALPGRSLLHTAPDQNCLMGKHIVEGDKVAILAHVPGWTQVRYTHPLTNVVTTGWLKSERVKPGVSDNTDRASTALSR